MAGGKKPPIGGYHRRTQPFTKGGSSSFSTGGGFSRGQRYAYPKRRYEPLTREAWERAQAYAYLFDTSVPVTPSPPRPGDMIRHSAKPDPDFAGYIMLWGTLMLLITFGVTLWAIHRF